MTGSVAGRRSTAGVLAAVAVGGQLLFLGAWLLLPLAHRGYDPLRETISVLAAVGAPAWPVMSAGFLACSAAFVAAGVLVTRRTGRRGAVPVLLFLAAAGTLAAGLARTGCGAASEAWCTRSPGDPLTDAVHATGAGLAFAALHTAALVVAVTARRGTALHGTRVVSAGLLAASLPHLAWFVLQLDDPGPLFGYAEKVFVTLTSGWSAWLAVWCTLASPAPRTGWR